MHLHSTRPTVSRHFIPTQSSERDVLTRKGCWDNLFEFLARLSEKVVFKMKEFCPDLNPFLPKMLYART